MNRAWWKEAVVYQIYPRSFKDSNGDGIGDIPGIIEKLDYIQELGVDVIWLNPVYKSPNDDNGYDISDYQSIHPEYGTMDDWKRLLDGLHSRGIKLIMDLVVNHTSDEHSWFVESRKSKDNPFREYYIWRPPANGKEPNSYQSVFGGPAWEYDAATGEYYFHIFSKKQPDLNWDNPVVRNEVFSMMKWWLDLGIDGFRMDVINLISKHPWIYEQDNPKHKPQLGDYANGPHAHDYLREMNKEVLSKYDVLTVGECPGTDAVKGLEYVKDANNELGMVFTFEHVDVDFGPDRQRWCKGEWKLPELKKILSDWQTVLYNGGWYSIYLTNHDQPRALSRWGNDSPAYREVSAKMLATMKLTLWGTPYIYMGEEIGMTNAYFSKKEEYRDIDTLNYIEELEISGEKLEDHLEAVQYRSRDNSRTPMQWDSGKNGGFTNGEPWIGINPNHKYINSETAITDPNSIFHYYRKLISIRKENPCLVYGKYTELDHTNQEIFIYTRILDNVTMLVVLNFTPHTITYALPEIVSGYTLKRLISNYDKTDVNVREINLKPYEAVVFSL